MSRAEQQQIAGTERPTDPDIEQAARVYRDARDARMDLTKKEVLKRDELVAVMRAKNVRIYKFDGPDGEELTVELDEKWKVKVKTKTPDEDA